MSPMLKATSDTYQDRVNFGASPQKKEMYGIDKRMDHSVAPAITEAEEIKLWRRIDLRLMPMISLMYLFSFMDRGNIGNAKLDGLMTQLNLTGDKYNIALTMFFIVSRFIHAFAFWFVDEHVVQSFGLFEFPSNLAIQVIRPSRWLPGITVLSGIVMTLMGFVKTYPQLVGARVCLGVAEAGFLPGVAYYLTMWYPKYMYQYRLALFLGATGLAGAFSGLLAYAIDYMDGDGGLEGWSWIFILEGVVTILVGFIAVFVMVDYPSTAKFLTAEERSFVIEKRRVMLHRMKNIPCLNKFGPPSLTGRCGVFLFVERMDKLSTSTQVWALATVQVSIAVPLFGITYFLPTIINDFGYSTSLSQLLTVPPYALATVTILVLAHFSDKMKLRSPFIFATQLIALLGYIINISDAPSGVKYFGTYLCVIGSFSSNPGSITVTILALAHFSDKTKLRSLFIFVAQLLALFGYIINISGAPSGVKYFGTYLCVIGSYSSSPGSISWLANNLQGKYKRAVGIALQLGLANLGGAAACNIFRSQDAPRYLLGHGLEIMFISIGLIAIPIIVLTYRRMNDQLDREELLEKQQGQDAESKGEGRASSTSSPASGFRYTL
ncbi:hypothetical protein PAXINDRAFT_13182 [Paxillus involutus ATCC 200175]|uniref:Major facilitator superfamily (MFS) profile domain-containing protein n=1 Tax=Paxillus involutus ATCC 200175 TaxID=664439 RepID=A0A0C9TEN7_PAXIN|nr:hypothetical protein PAXINDRAFT_13182 [Paxillus involutus ATCC 200175]